MNVLGGPLTGCSTDPLTGFYRDGACNTGSGDAGVHAVCAVMTEEFLVFSRASGNDLSTPVPAFGFKGLKPGDRWWRMRKPLERVLRRRRGAAGRVERHPHHGPGIRSAGGTEGLCPGRGIGSPVRTLTRRHDGVRGTPAVQRRLYVDE